MTPRETANEAEHIPFVENADGAYTFTIPVPALNMPFQCAAFSKNRQVWYDRQLLIDAASLPEADRYLPLIYPMACGAVATGADGVLIEVHNDPAHALCDGPQSLKPEEFDVVASKLLKIHGTMKSIR